MIVRFTDEALEDLSAIRVYLSHLSPKVADQIARGLVAVADSLADFPHRGRPGLIEGTRENISVSPYVIVYRIVSQAVV